MNGRKNLGSIDGFQSVYPEEWTKWCHVRKTVEKCLESFGFQEISTPSVERRSLYEVKPPWSEGLISQTFSFFDKCGDGLTLIPEQTPTRARMVQELGEFEVPLRWFNTSKRWRQEDITKKDRLKEFWQTDADIIGCDSVETDAEMLSCLANIYKNLGLYDKVHILVNDRKILENILANSGVAKEDYYDAVRIVDDKEKISEDEFYERFQKLGLNKSAINEIYNTISINDSFEGGIKKLEEINEQVFTKSREILKRLSQLSELLKWYGIYDICRLDLSIARGSFYTGIIFEVSDREKEFGALSGGGRYDWLISMYGKRDLPAIGFGFGHLGTIEMLKKNGLFNFENDKKSFFISCEDIKKDYKSLIDLTNDLRSCGHIVEMDIEKGRGNRNDYECVIILKKGFCRNRLVEINLRKKRSIIKIDDFHLFSENLDVAK